ncbi:uncharacterized protein LOC127639800 isoform X2 [Xyrauchen texanus]|uniref:uncharacterized protein LOC127639800 isoform X2 n=1 Tax=Xyrauchen texanus TaxID=154827 RepID=UPI002241AB09|nr:uncharacterized protein LOC127639800 isoform X2 [Xyrauchen texanus]
MKLLRSLLALQLFIVNGVFGDDTDEIKSVIERDSVTLDINVEKQKSDMILWCFGPEDTLIAQINGKANSKLVYDDVLDGIFRDRLELNITTGSLTIRNIRTEHSGLYKLSIISEKTSNKTFNVTVNGVFGVDTDEIKSVIEGDSVTLDINVEKQKSDLILWCFGPEDTLIAQINGKANSKRVYDDVLDGIFRDRLELNITTGSLTIRNITTEHSGLYKLSIISEKTSNKTFNVTVNGVFGDDTDEIKSVIERDSVTLDINVKKQKSDLILWCFGPEDTLIAQINGKANSTRVYDDVLDGRFKDRLELNITTGSLTIRDIRTEHSGLYTLRIISEKTSNKTFNVTVNERKSEIKKTEEIDKIDESTTGRSRSVSIIIIIITVCLTAVLIAVISAVICFRKHRENLKGLIKVQTSETDVLTEERRLDNKNQQQV